MLRVIPRETLLPVKGLYEMVSYEILNGEDAVGQLLIQRVLLDRGIDRILATLDDNRELAEAVRTVDDNAWDPCGQIHYVKSLMVRTKFRGNEYGVRGLLSVPAPSGTWTALKKVPGGSSGLNRCLARYGFRDLGEQPSEYLLRGSVDSSMSLRL